MRVIAVKVPEGEDPIKYLSSQIKRLGLKHGSISGIGGFEWVKIGVLTRDGTYDVKELKASSKYFVEAAPLIGNYLTTPDGGVSIHIHAVVGREHGLTWCGHLVSGKVKPHLEVFLHEADNDVEEIFTHRIHRE